MRWEIHVYSCPSYGFGCVVGKYYEYSGGAVDLHLFRAVSFVDVNVAITVLGDDFPPESYFCFSGFHVSGLKAADRTFSSLSPPSL